MVFKYYKLMQVYDSVIHIKFNYKKGKSNMKNNLNITQPDYFNKFKCIGGKCEDSCCIGWDIDIDQITYDTYLKEKRKDFNHLFKENMYKNNECSNEYVDYGKIKLDSDKRCPFLDSCNYCTIHSHLGEEYLSNTCSHFPRVLNKIDDEFEISLDIACPEAAQIVLNREEGIQFNKNNMDLKKYIVAGEIDTCDEDDPIKYFREIRNFCIDIIKDRRFDLTTRMYTLGHFLLEIEDYSQDNCDLVCELIKNYDAKKQGGLYRRNELNYIMQLSFFDNIVNSLEIYEETDSILFKQYTKEVLEGFNIVSSSQLETEADKYIDAFVNYESDYMEKYSSIFENYIVNFIFSNLFPYSESDSMFEGYIMLLVRYSLIRFYLVGKYLYNKSESLDDIIKFIQVFSKAMEHDKNYMEEILDYIIDNGFDDMEFAEMLI